MSCNLIEQVLKTIRNYELVKPGDKIMVAVSGGPDSVFLMLALLKLKNKLKIRELSVCNLDHGLRGAESKRDSAFAKRLAEKEGIRYFHKRVDLKKISAKGLSTEEIARQARYKFFVEAAAKAGAGVIATGHTLDDQAETIIMRLIKGSALKGIVGIPPARQEGNLYVIRPLIELEKSEIVQHLDDASIPYRIDRTNLEPLFFRNVVRGEIIPFLERYNPRLKRVLFNLAEHLREDFEFIEKARGELGKSIITVGKGGVGIALKDLVMQPRALQKEILRDSLEKAGGEVKKLSFRHWKELESLIRQKRKGSAVDLPGGVRASRGENDIVFSGI